MNQPVLVDPRPPPARPAKKPRTLPIIPCAHCGRAVVKTIPGRRFCSWTCFQNHRGDQCHSAAFIENLRKLWDRGLSASETARIANAALGVNINKDMVIGIAHRNGFAARPSPIKPKRLASG